MNDNTVYSERLRSNRTEALFILLTILFFSLFTWHASTKEYSVWKTVFICLFTIFLFYVVNYRTLIIRLTPEILKLSFGIFSWTIPIENIEDCQLDDGLPLLMKYGGAGIHFMTVHQRYRASFNFLEYPRVVVALKVKQGPVRDISFSTQQPDEVIRLVKKSAGVHEQ